MLKKTIPYIDLNGVERKEDFYFHLSKPEIVKMQTSVKGGYDVQLKSIGAGADGGQIMEFFEDLIKKAYGVKSEDCLLYTSYQTCPGLRCEPLLLLSPESVSTWRSHPFV